MAVRQHDHRLMHVGQKETDKKTPFRRFFVCLRIRTELSRSLTTFSTKERAAKAKLPYLTNFSSDSIFCFLLCLQAAHFVSAPSSFFPHLQYFFHLIRLLYNFIDVSSISYYQLYMDNGFMSEITLFSSQSNQ